MYSKISKTNKAGKPTYQSFLPNYKLSAKEIQVLLFFEQTTSLSPDYGDPHLVCNRTDFEKFININIAHFKDCSQKIIDACANVLKDSA